MRERETRESEREREREIERERERDAMVEYCNMCTSTRYAHIAIIANLTSVGALIKSFLRERQRDRETPRNIRAEKCRYVQIHKTCAHSTFLVCRCLDTEGRESLLKTDSGYPKDSGVTSINLEIPGNTLRYHSPGSALPVSALAQLFPPFFFLKAF